MRKNFVLHSVMLLLLLFLACAGSEPKTGLADVPQDSVPVKDSAVVGIQILGSFDSALVAFARAEILSFYPVKVILLDARPLPEMAYYPQMARYRADSLIRYLERIKPETADYILGLTTKDISTTKGMIADWGIFGLGFCPGPSCVVSTFRLRKNGADEALFRERFAKVLLHELGHNFGLPHCPNDRCIMGDAKGTIVTVDTEKKELCAECKEKLKKFGI